MLSNQTFNWSIRVYYEDTDSGGVVYHSNYLNFMERARTEWLRHLGFEQTYIRDELNVIFVVHNMQIIFKKPAKFNDMLTITSQLTNIGRGSFEFMQTITTSEPVLGKRNVLVEAQVKLACVNALTFKPDGIPKLIKSTMEQT